MAGIPLTGGNPAAQASTRNPQTNVSSVAGPSSQESSVLQPNTSSHQTGIPLGSASLSTVSLTGANASTTTTGTAKTLPAKHHVNGVDVGLVAVLFVIAAASFWGVSRTAKNTTY